MLFHSQCRDSWRALQPVCTIVHLCTKVLHACTFSAWRMRLCVSLWKLSFLGPVRFHASNPILCFHMLRAICKRACSCRSVIQRCIPLSSLLHLMCPFFALARTDLGKSSCPCRQDSIDESFAAGKRITEVQSIEVPGPNVLHATKSERPIVSILSCHIQTNKVLSNNRNVPVFRTPLAPYG